MKRIKKTPFTMAMSSVVISALGTTIASAESNPFATSELAEGYMQVAQSDGYSVKPWGGKKANEAACGEGKCGSMMENGKMKKGMENSCGAMMKGNEGACGNMSRKKTDKADGMSCGAMMEKMKAGEMSCGAMMEKMKAGEMSCGSKVDPAKSGGQ